jgi:phosphoglycolate phosphatase-like HAD superfamily hydrolase
MRPLLITDCDEVLLHLVRHFGAWLDEAHGIELTHTDSDMGAILKRRGDGTLLGQEEMWTMLGRFIPAELGRQTLVDHVAEALGALSARADIVILTNLPHDYHAHRIAQLERHGILHRVVCNEGGKGEPVARLMAEHGNPVTVFVDDRPGHHESVAEHAPRVHRLHLVAEPELAPHVPPAPHAHARIDDWRAAHAWIAERFAAGIHAG